MLVFNKKRIVFIITAFMVSMVYVSMDKPHLKYLDTMETSSVPASGHVIICDAGHGEPDGGAVSDNGVSEQEINLKIVLKLQELLEQSGSTVILTRSDENGVYDLNKDSMRNKKRSDLENRVDLANAEEADMFISIHLNKINIESVHGWQTFYQKNNENSKILAKNIQDNLNYSIQKDNKREILPLSGKYVMDNVKVPTVTVECGFLSNAIEAKDLEKEDYQEKIAWGIYTGIMDYFYN